jgi:RNA polymerase sigma-70 factor (ECF subfamily)
VSRQADFAQKELFPGGQSNCRIQPVICYNPITLQNTMSAYASLSFQDLANRCTSPVDLGAWEEFVRRLHLPIAKVVYRMASRMGDSSPQTVEDLIQETYLRLCARDFRALRSFEHRHEGAFLGFVQVVAANIVRDHFRSVHRNKQTPAELAVEEKLLAAPREAAGGIESMERRVLIREIDSQLNLCTTGPNQERNRRIFWLHYRSGLSACEIAALPGIGLGPKGVETLILRLRRELGAALARPRESKRSAAVRHDEGNESVKTL